MQVAVVPILLLLSLSGSSVFGQEIGCFVPGHCINAPFAAFSATTDSVDSCHRFCKSNINCNYFSFLGEDPDNDLDNGCFVYVDCPFFSEDDCENCFSGDADCPLRGEVSQDSIAMIAAASNTSLVRSAKSPVAAKVPSWTSSPESKTRV